METNRIKLTFTHAVLGTTPKDPELYTSFVADKAALDDEDLAAELATVDHVEEKGWTGFRRNADGDPFLASYMIKGFFKDACGMLRRVPGTQSKKVTAYKKMIDGLVFVEPDELVLVLPDGASMGVLERPLRAQTAQGERVALARSDTCPAGTSIEFEVTILGGMPHALLVEWLEYGRRRGLAQWRNAGYGRFTYEVLGASGEE